MEKCKFFSSHRSVQQVDYLQTQASRHPHNHNLLCPASEVLYSDRSSVLFQSQDLLHARSTGSLNTAGGSESGKQWSVGNSHMLVLLRMTGPAPTSCALAECGKRPSGVPLDSTSALATWPAPANFRGFPPLRESRRS
jgi:hypothetical protein